MKKLLLIAALLLLPCAASAQFNEAVPKGQPASPQAIGGPVGSPVFMVQGPSSGGLLPIGQAFGQFLAPYIDALVNAAIIGLLGWFFSEFKKRTGVEIDQQHRDAIIKALQNQAGSLIADGLVKVENGRINVTKDALTQAANDAMKVVPDAVKHFGLNRDFVADRIVDTIPQTAAGAQLIAPKS